MKKHFILACVAATAMLASCSNDNDEAVSQNVPVQFTISTDNIATRTTTTASGDTYSTTFNDGDKVGIFSSGLVDASGNSSDLSNASATVSGNQLTGGALDGLYYPKTGTARLAAYYPAGDYLDEGSICFNVQDDQNSADNFNKSDFMTSVVSTASTTNAVNFSMQHCMAFVELKLTNMDGASVTLNNVSKKISWNPQTNMLNLSEADIKSNIQMFKQSDNKTYWALLPAQTINSGATLFTIEHEGYTYIYNVSSALTLDANKVTRISLSRTLTGDLVVTPNINGENWGSTGDGGSGTVTDKNYIAMPENGALPSVTGFGSINQTTPWGYNTTGLTSAVYTDGVFTVVAKAGCHWAKTAIMAFSSEVLSVGQYSISFKIKASEEISDVTKVQVSVGGLAATNQDFFSIISGNTKVGTKTEGVKITDKVITLTFDTSNYYNAGGVSGNPTWTTAEESKVWSDGFRIAIAFGATEGTPITYTLSDLKITKN